jgi:hypothetical protein
MVNISESQLRQLLKDAIAESMKSLPVYTGSPTQLQQQQHIEAVTSSVLDAEMLKRFQTATSYDDDDE